MNKRKLEITHENLKKQKVFPGNKYEDLCLNIDKGSMDETDGGNSCGSNFVLASDNNQRHKYINLFLYPTATQESVYPNNCSKKEESPLDSHHNASAASGPASVTCDVCRETFDERYLLEKHYETHQEKTAKFCDLDPADSKQRDGRHNEVRMRTCNFKSLISLPKIRSDEKPHSCQSYGKRLSDEKCFINHQRGFHEGEKPYHCVECGMSFSNSDSFSTHTDDDLAVSGPSRVTCDVCSETFDERYLLEKHYETHQEINGGLRDLNPADLKQWDDRRKEVHRTTCNSKSLISSLKIHPDSDNWEDWSDFSDALSTHHRTDQFDDEDKLQTCSVCCKNFKNRRELDDHFRTHINKKYYECENCGMKYLNPNNLIAHRRRCQPSTDERGYEGEMLEVNFRQYRNFLTENSETSTESDSEDEFILLCDI